MSKKQKKTIKCLFIAKLKQKSTLYDFGLLTSDFVFYQCEIRTLYKDITSDLWLKLRRCFKDFQFTKDTDVMLLSDISVFEPIAFYLKILQEQIGFKIRNVDRMQIVRRIASYHPTYLQHKKLSSLRKPDVERLWNKILEYERCPWITKSVDFELKMSYKTYRERIIFLRLSLYYMLIKQLLYSRFKNSRKTKEQN